MPEEEMPEWKKALLADENLDDDAKRMILKAVEDEIRKRDKR